MANLQRLTERVKKMEEWVKENEDIGGPQGTLETFNFLVNETRMSAHVRASVEQSMQNLRGAAFAFIEQHELVEEWNDFLKEMEKEKEEDTKGKKPSKEEKSKETKK